MSSLFNIAAGGQAGFYGYQINDSLRFDDGSSANLNRTPSGSGDSLTTWTWSAWVKRGNLGTGFLFSAGLSLQPYSIIGFSSDQLFFDVVTNTNVVLGRKYTNAVFRDTSAWYNFVIVWDTDNATDSDKMRLYVNGSRITSFSLSTDPTDGRASDINSTDAHYIGSRPEA